VDLGLKPVPSLAVILGIIAHHKDANIRRKALDFFLKYFSCYQESYNGERITTAFLPTTRPNVLATPSDCFLKPECEIMGFKVLHPTLQHDASRLGVEHDPSGSRLMETLIRSPPEDEEQARMIFQYLYTQQSKFQSNDWERLAMAKIIPVTDEMNLSLGYKNAHSCYFKGHDDR
jgi:hypothetical protein